MTTETTTNDTAALADAASAALEKEAQDGDGAEPKSLGGLLKFLRKNSDGTNVVKETVKSFSNADGSDEKGDLIVQDAEDGLIKLKHLVESDKLALEFSKKSKDNEKAIRWEFRTSPHEQFGKTLDDTFRAFIIWSKTKDEDVVSGYNISKAFRRLASYADWMEETGDDLTEPALSADSCKAALDAWAMKCSVASGGKEEGSAGSFCWWIDLGAVDIKAVKKDIPPKDSLRSFVWYAHYVMYDENAQSNGILFFESCGNVGFMDMMTMVPMKLGVKLDRLTIGVLPIKMKKFYILETPTWMDMLMKFMSMFMSKKMKSRIAVAKDWSVVEEAVGGKESIPKGFGPLDGSLEMDPVESKYFSS